MAESVESLKPGDVLFVQGEKPSGLYMLQSGTLEILATPDEYDGLDRSIVISKSHRVGALTGKALLPGFAPHLTGSYTRSVRAITDATLTRFSLPGNGIQTFADSDPGQALNILKHLYNNIRAVSSYRGQVRETVPDRLHDGRQHWRSCTGDVGDQRHASGCTTPRRTSRRNSSQRAAAFPPSLTRGSSSLTTGDFLTG